MIIDQDLGSKQTKEQKKKSEEYNNSKATGLALSQHPLAIGFRCSHETVS